MNIQTKAFLSHSLELQTLLPAVIIYFKELKKTNAEDDLSRSKKSVRINFRPSSLNQNKFNCFATIFFWESLDEFNGIPIEIP